MKVQNILPFVLIALFSIGCTTLGMRTIPFEDLKKKYTNEMKGKGRPW
jgi:ABC-type dipeptide/oligopeptide/nickel transport system permease component